MLAATKLLPEASLEGNLDVDLIENYIMNGYSLPGLCEVCDNDIVLDCGAFNGNSSIVFARLCPNGKVFAFEPNPTTQEMLKRNLAKTKITNVDIVSAGVGAGASKLRFKKAGAASRVDPKGEIEVDIVSIDNFVASRKLQHVDFLKFDIEGAEHQAIRGAAHTIRHYRPKLAISVYHKFNDLLVIPSMIYELGGGWYDFYLRHNAITSGEIVLFCRPIEQA